MQIRVIEAIRRLVAKSDEQAAAYESEILASTQLDEQAEKEWQETAGKTIKLLEAAKKEASAKIKTASPEEKREIGEQIKEIDEEIKVLKAAPLKHFLRLPLEAKKFAASVQLLQKLIVADSDRIVGEFPDLFVKDAETSALLTDYDKFRDSQIAANISDITDYVSARVEELETKITNIDDIVKIVNGDFQKYTNSTGKPDLVQVMETSRRYFEEKAELAKQQQSLSERIEKSKTGIKELYKYEGGLAMYELMPSPCPTGKGHVSLKFDGDELGICVGSGGYDANLGKDGYRILSLRSLNKQGILEPHCTIEITPNGVKQIRGKSNGNVKFPYIPAVRDSLKFMGYDNKGIPAGELGNIGYVGDVDLYNLPEDGAEINSLKLYSGDYKYIDLSRLSVGNLEFKDKPTAADFNAILKLKKIGELALDADQVSVELLGKFDKIIEKIVLRNVTSGYFDAIPALRQGVAISNEFNKRLDTSTYSVMDFLKKVKGTENVSRTEDGRIVVKGNLDLSPFWATPAALRDIFVDGRVILNHHAEFDADSTIPLSAIVERRMNADGPISTNMLEVIKHSRILPYQISKLAKDKLWARHGVLPNFRQLVRKHTLFRNHTAVDEIVNEIVAFINEDLKAFPLSEYKRTLEPIYELLMSYYWDKVIAGGKLNDLELKLLQPENSYTNEYMLTIIERFNDMPVKTDENLRNVVAFLKDYGMNKLKAVHTFSENKYAVQAAMLLLADSEIGNIDLYNWKQLNESIQYDPAILESCLKDSLDSNYEWKLEEFLKELSRKKLPPQFKKKVDRYKFRMAMDEIEDTLHIKKLKSGIKKVKEKLSNRPKISKTPGIPGDGGR